MFILFIDDLDFLMDVIQLYSLPALHPSFSLPEAPRSANLLRQSNNFYARRAPVTQSSVSTRGGCLTRAFIFLWREIQAVRRARSQKTKDTKGQPKRERWEPFRAKVSAEPSAPCTASAAAPWVHSARPASPSQPSSSSPYQSAKVSQLISL